METELLERVFGPGIPFGEIERGDLTDPATSGAVRLICSTPGMGLPGFVYPRRVRGGFYPTFSSSLWI